jgi:tRNA(fMet)-specific endonuclease VapC
LERFNQHEVGNIAISSITVAELRYGVEKSQQVARNARALDQFLMPLIIVDFDDDAAETYGRIRAQLERQGTPLGPLDTLIAAHALCLNLTLVTNNTREFSRVAGLTLQNWSAS